ncbi:MAG: hypothetical protein Ct9H300mP7_4840 [Verrucomicrobiota bacterium]|nr:MAG: hypothetical protein Ct9H300mP7_4840 [Verrucomicrobiota bacterium]
MPTFRKALRRQLYGTHFARQRTAVGIAQHHEICPGLLRWSHVGPRVVRVILIAVKRMLRIVDDFLPFFFRETRVVSPIIARFSFGVVATLPSHAEPCLAKDGKPPASWRL